MNRGELDIITRYPFWQFFGTLTFKGGVAPRLERSKGRAMGLLFRASGLAEVPFASVVWALRPEEGEITHRGHFHYLLGSSGMPRTTSSCFILKNLWERACKGGMSRVYLYDASLHGAEYVVKCLHSERTAAATIYEVAKFGWTKQPPELSVSLRRYAQRVGGMERFAPRSGGRHGLQRARLIPDSISLPAVSPVESRNQGKFNRGAAGGARPALTPGIDTVDTAASGIGDRSPMAGSNFPATRIQVIKSPSIATIGCVGEEARND